MALRVRTRVRTGQAAIGGSPVFANPQVLIVTGDSQAKSTIQASEQTAAVAAYVAKPNIKIMDGSGAFVQYAPGTTAGNEYTVAQGGVGPELQFVARWAAQYPNDILYICKESTSGGFQSRGNTTGSATVTGSSGSVLTVNSGTVLGQDLLVGTGIDPGIYCPFAGFISRVGQAGGATGTGTIFSNVVAARYAAASSWSKTEGLAYNGNTASITNATRGHIATALGTLTSPKIACHIHIIGTNDASRASAATFAAELTAFLTQIATDFAANYTSNTKTILVRPMATGTSNATVRSNIATEASGRTGASMLDMDAQSVWDGTHWAIAGINYIGDQSFSTTFTLPSNTLAPAVTGTAQVGSVLTTTNGNWTGSATIAFTYQWVWADTGTNISGANSSTYTPVAGDIGHTIRCKVTATNAAGAVSANSNTTATVTAAPAFAFNTTVITGGATFSNANATEVSTVGNTTVIGDTAISGKKCFGMKVAAVSGLGNYGIVGISRATGTSAGIGFDGSNSYGAYSNGSNFPSGGNSLVWTVGADIGVVVDQAANLLWFTPDGVNFNGANTAANVAAGVGGTDISTFTAGPSAIFPCAGSFTNAGWGFTYEAYPFTPPSGFTSM